MFMLGVKWVVCRSLQLFFHLILNIASTESIASRKSSLSFNLPHHGVKLADYSYYSATKHAAPVDGGQYGGQIPSMLRTMRAIEGRFGHQDSDHYVGVLEMISSGMEAQQARDRDLDSSGSGSYRATFSKYNFDGEPLSTLDQFHITFAMTWR